MVHEMGGKKRERKKGKGRYEAIQASPIINQLQFPTFFTVTHSNNSPAKSAGSQVPHSCHICSH